MRFKRSRHAFVRRFSREQMTRSFIRRMKDAVQYLFRDEFYTDRAAGAVHGTPCEPGPGTRHVVDTDSKLTITNGKLSMAPHSTPVGGDPGFWLDDVVTRAVGVMLKTQLNVVDVNTALYKGFDNDKTGSITIQAIQIISDTLKIRDNGGSLAVVFVPLDATDYEFIIALKAAGAAYFIKESGIWKFLGNWGSNATAALYAGISNYDATLTSDYLPRIPETLWLPTPLCSDGFNRSDGAIGDTDGEGHAETSGLGSGGDGLSWTGATWTIDTNKAKNTPTEGSDVIVNGAFGADTDWTKGADWSIAAGVATKAAGTVNALTQTVPPLTANIWYKLVYDITVTGGSATPFFGTTAGKARTLTGTYTDTQRANETRFYFNGGGALGGTIDNVVCKPLTLSTLFLSLTLSTQDVVATCNATVVAGTQAGMVLNLDGAASPANFVIAYHDGINCKLEKCVAGTYTSVISATATYAAGAELKVHKDGTSYELFYNNAKVGSTSTISDAGIVDNLIHGLFSTYSGNRLDDYNVYARGTQNQHVVLDRF